MDNSEYELNNPLKYFSMADKSKGCNFSLSATNSNTIAKFSYMNTSPALSCIVLNVIHKTL